MNQPTTIHTLGPIDTYSGAASIAMNRKYDLGAPITPHKTIEGAIEATANDPNSKGCVALENSIGGAVLQTYDTLVQYKNLAIVAETILPIRHALCSTGTDIGGIKKLTSHIQALTQCGKYIRANLPNAKIVEATSTAAAAAGVTDPTDACISSIGAAKKYKLNILAECINNVPSNQTKFALLGHRGEESSKGDQNSTMICIVLKNEAGALHRATSLLAAAGINMTHISSRPIPENVGEYMFYIEMDGHPTEPNVGDVLRGLRSMAKSMRVLGGYEKPTIEQER